MKSIVFIALSLLSLSSCNLEDNNPDKGSNDVVAENQYLLKLEEMLNWYLDRDVHLGTGFTDSTVFISNKLEYLAIVRESGFFSAEFVASITKQLNQCEQKEKHTLDVDHISCTDIDLIFDCIDVDDIDKLEIHEQAENKRQDHFTFALTGSNQFRTGLKYELEVAFIEQKGKLVIDGIQTIYN